MFAKLGGATIFSTIDLQSAYYHIGLTRESQAKSAFVIPMGKWQFKKTPFGLSQAPAYFQLLIDQVLNGCGDFAMGYLDDIIIFNNRTRTFVPPRRDLQMPETLRPWMH